MTIHHKDLHSGRWYTLSFFEQMANIGSEVERAVNWKGQDRNNFQLATERALELIDLTIKDPKNVKRLRELCRLREVFADQYFDNTYQSTPQRWQSYFYPFIIAARKNR